MEDLKVVVVGHIDHGKSTLIGRLMYDTGVLSPDKIEEIEKDCIELGKELEFAYILDYFREERDEGITIDTTQVFFKSDIRNYVIIDTPGHKEYIQNMITGSSQADVAILVIDAKEGIMEQTKRHLYILNLVGIKRVIVVINKINLVDYSKEVYDLIKSNLNVYLENFSFDLVDFIPVNAYDGENLIEKSSNLNWYDGKCFLDILDSIEFESENQNDLCLPVQDKYENVIVGRIENGFIKKNQDVVVLPNFDKFQIDKILKFNEDLEIANKEESIGVKLIGDNNDIKRGDIITNFDSSFLVSKKIKANVFWILGDNFNLENDLYLRLVSQKVKCKISKVVKKIDSSTLSEIEISNDVNATEVLILEIEFYGDIVYSLFENFDKLGRFVLEFEGEVVAGGIIIN